MARRMFRCKGLLSAVLIVVLAVNGPAAADATECVDGPARLASAERPHLVDPGGDTQMPHNVAAGPDGYDIEAYWVGIDPGQPADDPRFTANIQVADVSAFPVNGVIFVHANGRWLSAKKTLLGEFEFQWGVTTLTTLLADGYDPHGWTRGWVDEDTSTVTIVFPAQTVPPAPADGREVRMPSAYVHTGDAIDSPVAIPLGLPLGEDPDIVGSTTYVDYTSADQCAAILYEQRADEDS